MEVKSTFLHNTKISGSRYYEDLWASKQRNSKDTTGVTIAINQIIHKVQLRDEVKTNLDFIDLSTLPFDLRPNNIIEVTNRQKKSNNRTSNSNDEDNDVHVDRQIPTSVDRERLDSIYHVTEKQRLTFGERANNNFDKVSEFSLREPRLLKCADTLEVYYRYIHVDKKMTDEKAIVEKWENNQLTDPWFDCLRRRTKIRMSGIHEFEAHVSSNISKYEGNISAIDANNIVLDIIRITLGDDSSLSDLQLKEKKRVMDVFIFDDSAHRPPIPVFSHVSPEHPVRFLTHLLLTLGHYDTEKDILMHSSFIECFRAAGLVGSSDDQDSLLRDCDGIMRGYIDEQLIYSPFALSKAEYYILVASQVIADAIMLNGISINGMAPVTIIDLVHRNDEAERNMWNRTKETQIDAILYQLCTHGNLPTREELMNCSRRRPLVWNAYMEMVKSGEQSDESFEEQRFAVGVVLREIERYLDRESTIQWKNPIIHGAPGTGKSYISFYCLLHILSKGLNVVVTALQGINASRCGGPGSHWHKFFCVDGNQKKSPPNRQAELAVMKIERDKIKVHKMRTMDVLFIDEFYLLSAEQLAVIDIILRKIRKSSKFVYIFRVC